MFQRFTVVMEYEQKPVLPPPLIIFCHIYATCKWVTRNVSHKRFQYDNGLKLFLEKEDMERLYDFEEECVEGYFREQVYCIAFDFTLTFRVIWFFMDFHFLGGKTIEFDRRKGEEYDR